MINWFQLVPMLLLPLILHSYRLYFNFKKNSLVKILVLHRMERFGKMKNNENQRENDEEKKRLRVLNFFVSNTFLVGMYVLGISLHTVLYLIVIASNPNYHTWKNCNADVVAFVLLVVQVLPYLVLIFVSAILIRKIKDSLGISWEFYFIVIFLLVSCIIFILMDSLGSFQEYVEFNYFSSGWFMAGIFLFMSFFMLFVPSIKTFVWERKSRKIIDQMGTFEKQELVEYNGTLDEILDEDRLSIAKGYFRRFLESEFASESLSCYEQVQFYKSLCNEKNDEASNRVQVAYEIFATFVDPNSTFPINITMELVRQVESGISLGRADLFDSIEKQLKISMMDSFLRFKISQDYKNMMNSIKKKRKLLDEFGIL